MRILFLDDMKIRHDIFVENATGHQVAHVYDAGTAIDAMSRERFDMVYLDHDLAEGQEDGRYVAAWMASNKHLFSESLVTLHTLNHPAALSMLGALRKAGIASMPCPFAWKVTPDEIVRDVFKRS